MTLTGGSEEPRMTSEDQIGQLLRLAGRRRMPHPGDMRQAHDAAHAEWQAVVRQRARRQRWRSLIGGTLAAAACAGLVAIWIQRAERPVPAVEIAAIQRVSGTVVVTSPDGGSRRVAEAGVRLRTGDRIEVPDDSRVAIAMTDSASARLDRGSAAVFVTADRLALERGAVYVQADGSSTDLRIETALGAVRHIGTRFEVRLQDAALRVRVREGSIALERGRDRWIGSAGEALTIAEGRPPERRPIAAAGPEWAWVAEIAAPFRLEGSTLRAFLEWVSLEQGWHWQVDDPRLRSRLDDIVLHGSIDGLTPEEALDAVLPASGLSYRRDAERLIVAPLSRSGTSR